MVRMTVIDQYFQTLRHLRPIQIWGRIRLKFTNPKPDISPTPPRRPVFGNFQPSARRTPSIIAPRQFNFLNKIEDIDKIGWDNPNIGKLWRYNQHYFDDLNALKATKRKKWHQSILQDWIKHNPPALGSGWEPYPTSLRIVNWIKYSLSGNSLTEPCQQSLAIQARWLREHLEWHLLGNHLFANAKALIFAGLWFEGEEAQKWLEIGFHILAREVPEQILPDGGQFELSPMYHALALEDMLDIINVSRCYSEILSAEQQKQMADWESRIPDMLNWLNTMSHPDGKIAFFNDAAFAIAPENSELKTYAKRLGILDLTPPPPVALLPDGGYARLSTSNAVLIADMARIGPDYLPGHAHADTLSFELSIHGQRVFVNSGTSEYGISDERLRQRGTSAHNSVVIAGRNSSEVWSGFRVARRAYPLHAKAYAQGEYLIAKAEHDGYRFLSGKPLHKRKWMLSSSCLTITDTITNINHTAKAYYHFHPEVTLKQLSDNSGKIILSNGKEILWITTGAPVQIITSTWHPEFGVIIPNTCLILPLRDKGATIKLTWN